MRGMGGMGGMMAQAQRMQAKLQKVQEEIKKMEIPGEAGNGAVKVVVNGQHRVLNVTIAPEAMDPRTSSRSPSTTLSRRSTASRKNACARPFRCPRA